MGMTDYKVSKYVTSAFFFDVTFFENAGVKYDDRLLA